MAPRTAALLLSVWCVLLLNQALWRALAGLPDFTDPWMLQRAGMALLLGCSTWLWLMCWSWPGVRRAAWSVTLVLAAVAQHAMLRDGTLMDSRMAQMVLQARPAQGLALLSPAGVAQLVWWAGVPVLWLCCRVRWTADRGRRALWLSALSVLLALGALAGGSLAMYRQLAPLVRNHMELRYLVNPLAPVVALAGATLKPLLRSDRPFSDVTAGAVPGRSYAAAAEGAAPVRPPLLVLVIGESARADHFGINGYPRDTTPGLDARHAISWRRVQSCGTSTQTSLPCMFSHLDKPAYERRQREYSNLLDLLQAAGLGVDWLDNQAGCKGVCDRVPHASAAQLATPQALQQWCADGECLDQLMLGAMDLRLQALPQAARSQGVVLVLHQRGSHGPAYYRRYSAPARQFLPECTTRMTADCSHAGLVNSYDNSLRETDLFLSRVIDWLQTHDDYTTALLYVGGHGESLGEQGLYLHGMPYGIAPDVQKHVPWVLWPGRLQARTGMDEGCARARTVQPYTHDHYFHTVLGMLDVRSPLYQPALDMLAPCRPVAAGAGRVH